MPKRYDPANSIEVLIADLISAAYDTGYYAGNGQSGKPLHTEAIENRNRAKAKLMAAIEKAKRDAAHNPGLDEALNSGDGVYRP